MTKRTAYVDYIEKYDKWGIFSSKDDFCFNAFDTEKEAKDRKKHFNERRLTKND